MQSQALRACSMATLPRMANRYGSTIVLAAKCTWSAMNVP